ncbi:MAG: hypothetical protein BAJALOKI1v1_970004 [Promethearchaeota archaeon]|nr:MAG: hypothetical protein BAJALOKI1v1_970004 [Candidatus Lokiarchaeota archaeon]
MCEVSMFFIKKRSVSKDFTIYRLPISSNEELLTAILEDEMRKLENSTKINFFEIFNEISEEEKKESFFIETENMSDSLKKLSEDIIIKTMEIESLSDYQRHSRAKDKYPFYEYAISKKKVDGNFFIGIGKFRRNYKLYGKKDLLFFKTADDFSIKEADNYFLIPHYISILIKGKWSNDSIELERVQFWNKDMSLFEKLFDYRKYWVDNAGQLKHDSDYLVIDDDAWDSFSQGRINLVRKFVRCISTIEKDVIINNVRGYLDLSNFPLDLGFQVNNGKVTIGSEEQINHLLKVIQKHYLKDPLETDVYFETDKVQKL